MAQLPGPSTSPNRLRPTIADYEAWKVFQATTLPRALSDAKAWRNGYAMLAGGVGALLGLIGDRLGDPTPWQWRLALSLTFGLALVLTSVALWLVLTIEGGYRTATVNLSDIVNRHNSFEMYQADQAAAAVKRLGHSRWLAIIAAFLAFAGLMITLWLPSPADSPSSATPVPASSASICNTPVPPVTVSPANTDSVPSASPTS